MTCIKTPRNGMTHRAPDFLIIGAQKAGTTSLYNCLKQHPEVSAANTKEVHYFSRFYARGLNWYLQQFPEREDGQLSGEASPFYFLHPQSARRIAETFPRIKLVLILRDPVERAISHYHQQKRRGHETLDMLSAFQNESQRIDQAWQRLLRDERISGIKVQQFAYLKRGEYLEQLLRYRQYFPEQQIHLMESHAFFEAPYPNLAQLFAFLGIDPAFKPTDLWPRKPGNYQKVDPAVLDYLRTHYRPHNEALYQHLGKRFSWIT